MAGSLHAPQSTQDILRGRSLAYLRRAHPAVWRQMRHHHPTAQPQLADGGVINLVFPDGTTLYPAPAPTVATEQIVQHLDHPVRLTLGHPTFCNLSPVSFDLFDRLAPALAPQADRLASLPQVESGFLFVFGIGLGVHLPPLIDAVPCSDLVLVETSAERLYHALGCFDWAELADMAAQRGMSVSIILEDDPDALLITLERRALDIGNLFLDGSHFFIHLEDLAYQQILPTFIGRLRASAVSYGFYEDEMIMLANGVANMDGTPFALVENRPQRIAAQLPALLVGAGPSLDEAIPLIQAQGGRGVVVSCGTALAALLRNGIRPQIHIEVENNHNVVRHLSKLSESHDFTGITLVAATTVLPAVARLFDKVWFFNRTSTAVTDALIPEKHSLSWADPTVANAAVAACAALGFKRLVLFGVDFGYRLGQPHHAQGTPYFTDFTDWASKLPDFDRRLPGNFGGEVVTNWVFELAAVALGHFLRQSDLEVINCSRGARIDGTRPLAAAALDLPRAPNTPVETMEALGRGLRAFAPGEFLRAHPPALSPHSVAALSRTVMATLADADAAGDGFVSLARRLSQALRHCGPGKPARRLLEPSLWSLLRFAAYFGTRIVDPTERAAFLPVFRAAYTAQMTAMLTEMGELAAAIASGNANTAVIAHENFEKIGAAAGRLKREPLLERLLRSVSL